MGNDPQPFCPEDLENSGCPIADRQTHGILNRLAMVENALNVAVSMRLSSLEVKSAELGSDVKEVLRRLNFLDGSQAAEDKLNEQYSQRHEFSIQVKQLTMARMAILAGIIGSLAGALAGPLTTGVPWLIRHIIS